MDFHDALIGSLTVTFTVVDDMALRAALLNSPAREDYERSGNPLSVAVDWYRATGEIMDGLRLEERKL